MTPLELAVILAGWAVAVASPGPATLAIAGTAMGSGRPQALALATGVITGSAVWGCAAALGLGLVLTTHAWAFEILRYLGAGYLLFLAWRAARSALSAEAGPGRALDVGGLGRAYLKGALIHLTNPKAVLFWGALFTVAVPPGAPVREIWLVFAACQAVGISIFLGYALLFSTPPAMAAYLRARRVFDCAFALIFGAAGLRLIFARGGV